MTEIIIIILFAIELLFLASISYNQRLILKILLEQLALDEILEEEFDDLDNEM